MKTDKEIYEFCRDQYYAFFEDEEEGTVLLEAYEDYIGAEDELEDRIISDCWALKRFLGIPGAFEMREE